MPGTTRYSATFDRPYEEDEDELPAVPPLTRRSRSQSWQAPSSNSRPYTPLGGNRLGSHARSSSTDNGPQAKAADGSEKIPTRTAGKVSVKVAHNPFQFVKIGSCPLSKKAEELLKKTQEKKKPEVLKEEEEWQTNLDSWKNRRRKMSEHTIRRQEELKQLEMEEQSLVQQKKIKTFSEMLEERAHQGRSLSLSFFSNPLEVDDWDIDNVVNKDFGEAELNDRQDLFGGSEESSNINSEDESDVFQKNDEKIPDVKNLREKNTEKRSRRTGNLQLIGSKYGMNNGIFSCEKNNSNCGNNFLVTEIDLDSETLPHKDETSLNGVFIDSGLDSLSSSHRAGDIPDSGSDFSQDSGSSLDCESPNVTGLLTTGMELLEEFSSKETTPYNGVTFMKEKVEEMQLSLKLNLTDNKSQFGFTVSGGKDKDIPVTVVSVLRGSVCDAAGLKVNDQILTINKDDVSCLNHSVILSALKQATDNKCLELLLWRPNNYSNVDKTKKEIADKLNKDAVVKKPSEDTVIDKLNKDTLADKMNKDAVVDKTNKDVVLDKTNKDAVVEKTNKDTVVDKTNKDAVVQKTNKNAVDKQNNDETFFESILAVNASKPFTGDEVVKSSFSSTVNQSICNKESIVKRSPICMNEKIPEKGTVNKIKKVAPTKQKDATRKKQAPVKPLAQELPDDVINKDATDNLVPLTSTNSDKSIELESKENEEVDNLSAVSNSKIPVAEKCTKYSRKEISRTTQESKKGKYSLNDKSLEILNNGAKSSEPSKDNSLNIIYESHPILCNKDQQQPVEKETKNKTSSHAVIKNASENKSTVKSKNDPRIFPKNMEPKMNENTNFDETNISSVEKVAEEMERLILEQLEQEEQMKERSTKETVLESTTYGNRDISEPDNTLHDMDTPLRQLEPPKEKPPPPPLSLSTNNSEMDSSLTRVNSTMRIKKEIQKRRSDFLGIDSSEEGVKYESSLPSPPSLEHILKAECDQEKKIRQKFSKQSVTPTKPLINEDEIAQKEREIIENLETEERMRMETQICTDMNSTRLENCDIEEERIRKLKEERQRMEEERFLKEEQRIRFEEERQLRDREQQIKKQEDPGLLSMPLILNSVPQTVVDDTSDAAENKNFPVNDKSLDKKSDSFNFPVFTNSAVRNESNNATENNTLQSNCLSRQAVVFSCCELKAGNKNPKPCKNDTSQNIEKICSSVQLPSKQIVSTKNKIMKKKSKNVETSESLSGHYNTSVANEKNENILKEKTCLLYKTHELCDNTREINGNSSSALNEGKITTLEGSPNKAFPSISEQCVPEVITSKTGDNFSHKGKANLVKIRRKKNVAARLTGNCMEQDDQKSIASNFILGKVSSQSDESVSGIAENANIVSNTCLGTLISSRCEQNSRLQEMTLGKENKSQNFPQNPGKHSVTNQQNLYMIRAHEKVTEGDTLDATTSPSSVAGSSTNPECITPVSILSSTSLGISNLHHGDGKILNSSSVFPAEIDVSNAQGENVNTTPPKPLKKKEAIRRERERLRQEQEALQREREDHRRQLLLEQERLKKDLPKPHAREDYTSYVGPPPPVKPALPLPLTPLLHPSQTLREDVIYSSRSFPGNLAAGPKGNIVALPSDHLVKIPLINTTVPQSRVGQSDEWSQHKVSSVRKQIDSPSESRYNQNHWLIQEAEMRRISEQNERQRLHPPSDTHHAQQKEMQYHPVELGDKGHSGSHCAVQRQIVQPISCPSLKQSSYPVSTPVHSPEQLWSYGQPVHSNSQSRKCCAPNPANIVIERIQPSVPYSHKARVESGIQPPTKPSRVLPLDRQDQMLSVSGRKRCSHCGEELGRGAAMIIESLQLYFHIHCFRCCVCQAQLGNGSCGTDVRVRNNKLHCHNCYSNDEAGLKFSQV